MLTKGVNTYTATNTGLDIGRWNDRAPRMQLKVAHVGSKDFLAFTTQIQQWVIPARKA